MFNLTRPSYQLNFRSLISSALTFHDGGAYHIEISQLICSANQCSDFYMIGTSVTIYVARAGLF